MCVCVCVCVYGLEISFLLFSLLGLGSSGVGHWEEGDRRLRAFCRVVRMSGVGRSQASCTLVWKGSF